MALNPDYILAKLHELPKDRGVKILPGNGRAFLKCSWHTRDDGSVENTPSFLVHIDPSLGYTPGSGFCFACKKKIKDFRVVCDPALEGTIEGETLDETDQYVYKIHSDAIKKRLFGNEEDNDPYDLKAAMPWMPQESWRTIPGAVLKAIDAKTVFDPQLRLVMAYFPCRVHGEHVGGIRARLIKSDDKSDSSYYNTPGPWARQEGLFPFDQVAAFLRRKHFKTVVLVEGPRDALRCLSFGIPALAILGTNGWSETKAEHIFNLGIQRVVTAFDPDKAGLGVTKDVYLSFRDELQVQRFDFGKHQTHYRSHLGYTGPNFDPGNAPVPVMEKLKTLVGVS